MGAYEDTVVSVTLALTRNEWCELANALDTKAIGVESGEYGDGGLSDQGNVKWISTLKSAYAKVSTVLDSKHISY